MPVEGALSPNKCMERMLLLLSGERSESLSGEAPAADAAGGGVEPHQLRVEPH